jgi:hypothetical protein
MSIVIATLSSNMRLKPQRSSAKPPKRPITVNQAIITYSSDDISALVLNISEWIGSLGLEQATSVERVYIWKVEDYLEDLLENMYNHAIIIPDPP